MAPCKADPEESPRKKSRVEAAEVVVDLTSDASDQEDFTVAPKRAKSTPTPSAAPATTTTMGDEDDVVMVDAPAAAPLNETAEVDEDGVVIVGRTGQNSVEDFPHARHECGVHPFTPGNADKNEVVCPNCWCFVCDKKVAECPTWRAHCCATSADAHWRSRRASARAAAGAR